MDKVCIGMVGAGRACELHMQGLNKVSNIPLRYKTIVAKRKEQLLKAQKAYGFENISLNFDDLINDEEIDVIDICTPPYVHEDMIIKALKSNKHVICEKPITGYFGQQEDTYPIGKNISKSIMYDNLLVSLESLKNIVDNSNSKFMYAENFVYAPSIIKAGEIIRSKKSRVLYMIGEESLKGSSSHVANQWNKTGGGSLMRVGSHPLSAALWLKQQESLATNKNIYVESVLADAGTVTKSLSEYEHRHIMANPNDVEDNATVLLTFSDKSKALIIATDLCLGGSKNYIDIYCNDSNLKCKLTLNDNLETYFLDEDGLNNVYISEMLPSKTGWNKAFVSDEVLRGYHNEMQDFMNCIFFDAKPRSDFKLAYETAKIIYAAYKSSEIEKKVYL